MEEIIGENKHLPSLQEFYDGKSVFLTGASGFIGSVLLETLLRCCPGIKSIYIHLRTKKNVNPDVRKQEIFEKKIFEKLKQKNEELFKKVHVIPGDLKLPNLGISDEDIQLLVEEIAIVFHCAASVHLLNPLQYMVYNIVFSLHSLIGLCRKMKKFEAFVYTSTAYSNSNRLNIVYKEEVYRLPFRTEKILEALKTEDNAKLHSLAAQCKPDFPNTYVFSKCLAENLIMDTASDLPVVIIRPSGVICTWKHPVPGYLEGHSGLAAVSFWAGKGVIKVIHVDPETKLNLVPVDIVANAHVVAAWSIGTKRCVSPMVVNCSATEKLHLKLSEFYKIMHHLILQNPLPQSFMETTGCAMQSNRLMYYIISFYHHYLPAAVFDVLLKISGRKSRMLSLYRYFDKMMVPLELFTFHTYEFENNNLEYLDNLISPEDRKNLALDFKDATYQEMALKIPESSIFFDWKIDKKSPSERQKTKQWRYLMITSIKVAFLTFCCLIVSWILFIIFQ